MKATLFIISLWLQFWCNSLILICNRFFQFSLLWNTIWNAMHFGSHFSFILYLQFDCNQPGACHTLNVSCNAIDADRLVKPTKKLLWILNSRWDWDAYHSEPLYECICSGFFGKIITLIIKTITKPIHSHAILNTVVSSKSISNFECDLFWILFEIWKIHKHFGDHSITNEFLLQFIMSVFNLWM